MNHNLINLHRLVSGLEVTTQHVTPAKPDAYYEIKKLKANQRYGVDLLLQLQSSQATGLPLLQQRLDALAQKLDRLQSEAPVPSHIPPTSFPFPDPPALPVLSSLPVVSSTDASTPTVTNKDTPTGTDKMRPLNLDPLPLRSLEQEQEQDKHRKRTTEHTGDTSTVLQHHRQVQDDLATDLAGMATQLRLNALQFQSTLRKDRDLVEAVEEKMDSGLTNMSSNRTKLKAYERKGGWTTCYVFMAMVMVCVAWLMMFFLIRIT